MEVAEVRGEREEYSTTADTCGVGYREIADILTLAGQPMNHSSARNHVNRALVKVAEALCEHAGAPSDLASCKRIARSARFQAALAEVLHDLARD